MKRLWFLFSRLEKRFTPTLQSRKRRVTAEKCTNSCLDTKKGMMRAQGVGGGWVRTFQQRESLQRSQSEASRGQILNKSSLMVAILYRLRPKYKVRECP